MSTALAPASQQPAGQQEQREPGRADLEDRVAQVTKRRAGLYADKAAHPEFARVVLVTAANKAYMQFYKNWECAATRLGLDWAVLANDDASYEELGPERAMPVLTPYEKVSSMVGWGSVKLDYVGRNKMHMVQLIMRLTGLDVVFTDADNVFRRDPFRPGASLGDLIRAQSYDYIYQPELSKRPPPGYKSPGDGGNTGFFFAAGSRKPENLQSFFGEVVAEVDRQLVIGRGAADQPIWWQVFNRLMQSQGKQEGPWGFKCGKMCGQQASCSAPAAETLEYCGMDPFRHPTGWDDAVDWLDTIDSYHANYA
eukprot:3806329-Heterocapsa_arctica.AAC.1